MSNVDDFAAKQEAIEAIAAGDTRTPNIPVSIYIQEAENLHTWSTADKAALTGAGLNWTLVDDLPLRCGALREAESLWFKERHNREDAEKDWHENAPRAYNLRDGLLRAMRYAYRTDSNLLNRVSAITAGNSHADMIQDLNDIAVLGHDNSAPLTASQLNLAAATADEMAALLARVNGDRKDGNSAKITRDKTYTYLKQLVDEIRACGQYVFWNDPLRLRGYSSAYYRRLRGSKGKGIEEKTNQVPVEESSL